MKFIVQKEERKKKNNKQFTNFYSASSFLFLLLVGEADINLIFYEFQREKFKKRKN